MARTRRTKARQTRTDKAEARKVLGTTSGPIRVAYHSASKDEITVRRVKFLQAKRNKNGGLYLVVMDLDKGAKRNLTPSRIGWSLAA